MVIDTMMTECPGIIIEKKLPKANTAVAYAWVCHFIYLFFKLILIYISGNQRTEVLHTLKELLNI